jgi:L-amino acid N-acyltransferase YncA
MNLTIDAMSPRDWESVRAIYLEGIATGIATFETSAPSWEDWDSKHLLHSRLVARKNGEVAGWAALSPVSRREVYAGVAEVSIYVGTTHRGSGIGRVLLAALIDESERNGIWTLQAGIFPENERSLNLHKLSGFREVGRRERIAQLKGQWRDVVLLERRSQ